MLSDNHHTNKPARVLLSLVLLLIVVGICLRLGNLDRKFPWMDECITQVRLSDYSFSATKSFPSAINTPIRVADLKEQIEAKPRQKLMVLLKDTLAKVPEHPPIYYLLSAKLAGLWGNRIVVFRQLAAVISLLAFPCMYWLCLELFRSPIYALIGVGTIAISPVYILYAQEAREYSLWIVAGLFSSASLLSALRQSRWNRWLLYTISLIIGLYSHLLFGLNLCAHLVYILTLRIAKANRKGDHALRNYGIALASSALCFSPWLMLFIQGRPRISRQAQWFAQGLHPIDIIKRIVGSVVRVFFDVGFDDQVSSTLDFNNILGFYLPCLVVISFVLLSVLYILRSFHRSASLFSLSLIVVPILILILSEFMTGKTLTQTRYLMPAYLGIQLSSVQMIGDLYSKVERPLPLIKKAYGILVVLVMIGGVISCGLSSQEVFWWNKGITKELSHIARLVNRDNALVLSDMDHLPGVFSLAYQLDPSVLFQFSPQLSSERIPATVTRLYFLGDAGDFVQGKNSNLSLTPLIETPSIFNLSLYALE